MNMENKIQELLTLKEVCEILKCHPNTLRKWDKQGILVAIRLGKRGDRRYRKKDIIEFLEKKVSKKYKQLRFKNNSFRKVGKYGMDLGERGIYDIRNTLNDLTGKEWTYFLNSIHLTDFASDDDELKLWKYLQDSIIPTKFSTNGENSFAHNLRKIHPSPKPPQLMKDIIEFFTKKGQLILDPFMGVGGTLLGASLSGRKAVGVDLCEEYIEVYKKVTKKLNLKEQITLKGDARNIDKYPQITSKIFDAIITDPPYANLLSKKRTGGDRTKKIGTSTPFTDSPKDLGNLDYNEYLSEMRKIIEKALLFLKTKGYLVLFTKDIQPNKKHHNMLHADLVNILIKIKYLTYKGYKIWYDKTINLYPYGYPFSFVANQLHQYILIFRKDN